MPDRTRWAWARLNADTLFLALLATLAGLFAIIDGPRGGMTTEAAPLALHYLRSAAYILAGLLLTGSLLWSSVRVEVIARSALLGGVALNLYRHAHWLGWQDTATLSSAALLVIVALTSWLRLSMLLRKGGVVVTHEAAAGEDR